MTTEQAMTQELSVSSRSELIEMIELLRKEVEGCNAFQRSINEALNMGDGTYRP